MFSASTSLRTEATSVWVPGLFVGCGDLNACLLDCEATALICPVISPFLYSPHLGLLEPLALLLHPMNHHSQFFDKMSLPWNSPFSSRKVACWIAWSQSGHLYKVGYTDTIFSQIFKQFKNTFQKLCPMFFRVEIPRVLDFLNFLHCIWFNTKLWI